MSSIGEVCFSLRVPSPINNRSRNGAESDDQPAYLVLEVCFINSRSNKFDLPSLRANQFLYPPYFSNTVRSFLAQQQIRTDLTIVELWNRLAKHYNPLRLLYQVLSGQHLSSIPPYSIRYASEPEAGLEGKEKVKEE